MANENLNPFIKASQEAEKEVKIPSKEEIKEENKTRKSIDETTISESNWIKLPSDEQIGTKTELLKIKEFFQQPAKEYRNKETGETFWSGLTNKKGEKFDEYVIEGTIQTGEIVQLRLSSWEVFYKMLALVKYCKANNFTLVNQSIQFERVNSGGKNAGKNWVLHVPSLKIKFEGENNQISQM